MKRKALTLFLAYVMLTGCGASSEKEPSAAYLKSSGIPPATVTAAVTATPAETASVTAAVSSEPEKTTSELTQALADTSIVTEKGTSSAAPSQTTTVVSTTTVTSATEQTKEYADFFGVLIDEDCSDHEDPPRHDTDCMFMEECRASGYGIDIEQEDGSWVFYMFNDNGQALAWDLLNTTKRPDGLFVTVTGEWDNGKIKVISIKES